MKRETRFQLILFTLLALTFTAFLLDLSLHRHWFGDLAGIFLGACLQAIIIPLAWLALKNQRRALAGRRLFWSRLVLVIIIALFIGGIATFQVDRVGAAITHYQDTKQ